MLRKKSVLVCSHTSPKCTHAQVINGPDCDITENIDHSKDRQNSMEKFIESEYNF